MCKGVSTTAGHIKDTADAVLSDWVHLLWRTSCLDTWGMPTRQAGPAQHACRHTPPLPPAAAHGPCPVPASFAATDASQTPCRLCMSQCVCMQCFQVLGLTTGENERASQDLGPGSTSTLVLFGLTLSNSQLSRQCHDTWTAWCNISMRRSHPHKMAAMQRP